MKLKLIAGAVLALVSGFIASQTALSKRTTLYGQLAYARANALATLLTTVVLGGTASDTSTSLLNVGIKHAF